MAGTVAAGAVTTGEEVTGEVAGVVDGDVAVEGWVVTAGLFAGTLDGVAGVLAAGLALAAVPVARAPGRLAAVECPGKLSATATERPPAAKRAPAAAQVVARVTCRSPVSRRCALLIPFIIG